MGFSLRRNPEDGHVEVMLSKRSKERIDAKIREMTPRTWGQSLQRLHHQAQRLPSRVDQLLRDRAARKPWNGRFTTWTLTSGGACGLCCFGSGIVSASSFVVSSGWGRVPPRRGRRVYEGHKSLWALSHCGSVDPRPQQCVLRGTGASFTRAPVPRDAPSRRSGADDISRWNSCGQQCRRRNTWIAVPPTPTSRRAGCEAHKSGSVRGAPGRTGVPTRLLCNSMLGVEPPDAKLLDQTANVLACASSTSGG